MDRDTNADRAIAMGTWPCRPASDSAVRTLLLCFLVFGLVPDADARVIVEGSYGTLVSQRIYLRNAFEDYELHGLKSECVGGSLVIGSTRASGMVSGLHVGYTRTTLELEYDYELETQGGFVTADGNTTGEHRRYTAGWWYGVVGPRRHSESTFNVLVCLSREHRTYDASLAPIGDPSLGMEIELSEISFDDTYIGFRLAGGDFVGPVFLEGLAGCELVVSSGRIAEYEGRGVGGTGYLGVGVGVRIPRHQPVVTMMVRTQYFYNHSSIKEEMLYEVLDNTRHEVQTNLSLGVSL